MYRKLRFLIFFLLPGFILAQTIALNWESPRTYYDKIYNDNLYPFFNNEGYSVDQDVPHFSYSQLNVNFNSVEISDLQWEPISINELASTPLELIPTDEQYRSNVVKSRGQKNLAIEITPFKKIDNNVYRLKSFSYTTGNIPEETVFGPISDFSDSVLKTGTYYKISVDTTGVYKIDYNFLADNGLNPSTINPDRIKVYGNGGAMLSENLNDFAYLDLQETSIKVIDGNDGSFDTGDYILFYAQGPHSFKRNLLLQPIHITNIYEDRAYYYIRFDGPNGKRINDQTTPVTSNYLTEFDDIRVYEPELYNVNECGRIWVGENFSVENTLTINFNNLIEISNSVPVRCQLSLYTEFAQLQLVKLNVNGNNVIDDDVSSDGGYFNSVFNGNLTLTGNSLNVEVKVDNAPNLLGKVWFNYVELFFRQKLKFNNTQFNFRRLDNINNGNPYGFRIADAGGITEVWDVSDWVNPKNLINNATGANFEFTYQSLDPTFSNEFVAYNANAAYSPVFEGLVRNQNLRGLNNIDYLIVVGKDFQNTGQNLADFHEEFNGLNVAVATPQQIYNEFSSGSQDISAIRNFARYLYKKDNQLKFLLLFGDSSYDFKDRIPNNTNVIPSCQSQNSANLIDSWVTDDFFGILDDGEFGLNSLQLDLGIGRLPAANPEEANYLLKKSLSYENSFNGQSTPFGIWRTKTKIVVDDDDSGDPFQNVVEPTVSQYISNTEPQLNVRKLYLDAFQQVISSGGLRYPEVNTAIDNSVESGSLLINYFGHGGPRSWAQERVLTAEQILSYQNMNSVFTRLPLFTTVTCDFSVWDNPNLNSAGEFLVKSSIGGGVASITTSRAIGVPFGKAFNGKLIERLFQEVGKNYNTFGEALTSAKMDYFSYTNNYKVNLLGDPALSLNRPPRKIELTLINGEPADTYSGVLRALDFVTIDGIVLDDNDAAQDTSFNGTVDIELYDKVQQKQTLNNDGNLGVLQYEEQNVRIYSGSSTVTDGSFHIGFYMPKDIDYNIGNGKLVLYAENNVTDGLYYDNTILVGDINPDGIDDDEPPVARLFLNNRHFANGGITNKDPIFIACVTDSTGINSTGVGIGHDITLVLDDNINETKVLNSFYEGGEHLDCPNPSLEDYQKGMVTFNLKDLDQGEHQIKFKVWDINNNSTTETLDFVVVQEGEVGLVINRLLNWPNPFTDKTYFHFEHNCDEILEVQIQIFSISGKLVKTIRQSVTSDPYRKGYRTDKFGVEWDGLDDYGQKIGKGTYIFKATVKGSDSEKCSGTATATEKLVILK